MSDKRIIVKDEDGKTTSFKDNEVQIAVQFHRDAGGRITVDDVDITEVAESLTATEDSSYSVCE